MKDVAGYLAKYNDQGCRVPTEMADGEDGPAGNGVNNARSKELLGIQYTDLQQTVCEMADQMISSGKVKLAS